MDQCYRQKISKETVTLNDTLGQIDLINIYRTFYHKAAEHTFFSSTYGIFSKTDHMLVHKISLNKFKKIEIIPNIFLDHSDMKQKKNYDK